MCLEGALKVPQMKLAFGFCIARDPGLSWQCVPILQSLLALQAEMPLKVLVRETMHQNGGKSRQEHVHSLHATHMTSDMHAPEPMQAPPTKESTWA